MKRNYSKFLVLLILLVGAALIYLPSNKEDKIVKRFDGIETKIARQEYFLNKLKDPKTQKIPSNVRHRELMFAEEHNHIEDIARTASISHVWNEVGPSDVGGRTRAIVLDSRDSNTIFAGGISGGIWKSTDGGTTWSQKLSKGSHLSVSYIAQDAVSKDIWYAGTGELGNGGSTSGKGSGNNPYMGTGLYKSTDNGESWVLMTYAADPTVGNKYNREASANTKIVSGTSFYPHPFILTGKLISHSFDGSTATLFVTTQYLGLYKSTDGGESFTMVDPGLPTGEYPYYCDITIDQNHAVTIWMGPTDSSVNGFFRSNDQGSTYAKVNPSDYPGLNIGARAVLAYAPSSPSKVYSFIYDGFGQEANYLYSFDYTNLAGQGTFSSSNRTANLPTYSRSIFGGEEKFSTQQGYDMILAVHPTTPDLVVLGYVNLIKSEDGFATSVTGDPAKSWIGGNENPWRLDQNLPFGKGHHADQHSLFFDPANPNVLYSGHDGGVSKTTDITADRVVWSSLNNNYNITQYYHGSISRSTSNGLIFGGTQDNGTPTLQYGNFSGSLLPTLGDVSSGDGSFCYMGTNLYYASAQNGALAVGSTGNINNFYRYIERSDFTRLFIHPFAVDPNDEGTLFFPDWDDGKISRNDQFDEFVTSGGADLYTGDLNLITNGWDNFTPSETRTITAIKVSDKNPSNRLYFGGNKADNSAYIGYWNNANTSSDFSTATINSLSSSVANGLWLNDIGINPQDANEIILVYSNYNVTGIYHSTDGGATVTAIEGTLAGDDAAQSIYTGPSIRAAEILDDGSGNKKYIIGTSIGVYSTTSLNGGSTSWALETDLLQNVVIEDLDSRPADQQILAATHGRGLFIGKSSSVNQSPNVVNATFELNENSAGGTIVGTVSAADPESDALTYVISSGNDAAFFAINSGTGEISVAEGAVLDFEGTNSFDLMVAVSDASNSSSAQITIKLLNVNEAPEFENIRVTIDENTVNGASVTTLVASDPENDSLAYSITGGNTDNAFLISSSGELTVGKEEVLDFEQVEEFILEVEISDGALSIKGLVTVGLNDLDDVLSTDNAIEISYYPNPVSDVLNVKMKIKADFEVSNISGQKIEVEKTQSEGSIQFKFNSVPNGIYFLNWRSEDESGSIRIVKE